MKFFEVREIFMRDDIAPFDEHGLIEAADKVHKFMMEVSPNPGDALGIACMLITNFLASGITLGMAGEEITDMVLNSIRENVSDSVAAIYDGLAADVVTETIQ
jgi:hypothetical protein